MRRTGRQRAPRPPAAGAPRTARAAAALLLTGAILLAVAGPAAAGTDPAGDSSRGGAWNEFGLPAAAAPARGDSIVEPFFAFVLDQAAADSLGLWRTAALKAYAAARGTPSRLPVEHLVSLERRRPAPGSEGRYPGARVAAEWVLAFDDRLSFPLPYSLLGYHPGSLRLASTLVLAELAPVDLTLSWRVKRGREQHPVKQVRVFVCERGYMLLDADAFVDHLLGDLLDDAWTVGFATARDGDHWLAISLMLGREGRAMYGEFDLARDRIEPHGRPLAEALAAAARRWQEPFADRLPVPWVEE
jgi:hypothetical protein